MIKSFEDESGVSSATPFQLAQGDEVEEFGKPPTLTNSWLLF